MKEDGSEDLVDGSDNDECLRLEDCKEGTKDELTLSMCAYLCACVCVCVRVWLREANHPHPKIMIHFTA